MGLSCLIQAQEVTIEVILCKYSRQYYNIPVIHRKNYWINHVIISNTLLAISPSRRPLDHASCRTLIQALGPHIQRLLVIGRSSQADYP